MDVYRVCFVKKMARINYSVAECNTILSAYTKFRHLGQCCAHASYCSYNYYNENYIYNKLMSPLLLLERFSKRKIFDPSKHKGFADDNFKLDDNGRRFSKRVENTVGKGEIARNEQFLLFPRCFQKTCTADT